MNLVTYNHQYQISDLLEGDFVKITLSYNNAYNNNNKNYVGTLNESIWCKIVSIDKVIQHLYVSVSNNCIFSNNKNNKPYQLEDILFVNIIHIKEHKRYTGETYKDTLKTVKETIEKLPLEILDIIKKIPNENDKTKFIDQYLFTNVNISIPCRK
tara:strand:- start:2757 stop:3221 length:465 start_codon:yes stop_codon:yes gene_type:complete